jgi:hypothetical protein
LCCDALEIGNTSLAVSSGADREKDGLDDDEKGVATVIATRLVINECIHCFSRANRSSEVLRDPQDRATSCTCTRPQTHPLAVMI